MVFSGAGSECCAVSVTTSRSNSGACSKTSAGGVSVSAGRATGGAAFRVIFRALPATGGGGGTGIEDSPEPRASGTRGEGGLGAAWRATGARGASRAILYAATPAMNNARRMAPSRKPRRMSSRNRTVHPSARRRLKSTPDPAGFLPEFNPQTRVRRLLRRAAGVPGCASGSARRCSSGAENRHCRRDAAFRLAGNGPWLRAKIDRP
jgi:hypothetical protein